MFESIISIINEHLIAIYLLVFLISFFEFIIVIGNVVPGTTLLIIISFLSANSNIYLSSLFLLALLGSTLGDFVSYYLGKKYGIKIFKKLEFSSEKQLADSFKRKIKEGKWLSFILLGKLNSFIRSFTGFSGGIREMSIKRFFLAILIGNIAWVSIYICLPYTLGYIAKKYVCMINGITFILVVLIFIIISIADGSMNEIISFVKNKLKK